MSFYRTGGFTLATGIGNVLRLHLRPNQMTEVIFYVPVIKNALFLLKQPGTNDIKPFFAVIERMQN